MLLLSRRAPITGTTRCLAANLASSARCRGRATVRRRRLTQQRYILNILQLRGIAQKLIAMPFALHLAQNIDAIIITQGTRHFVIVHRQMILLDAPQLGQAGGIDNLKDAGVSALPGDEIAVLLVAIVKQLL